MLEPGPRFGIGRYAAQARRALLKERPVAMKRSARGHGCLACDTSSRLPVHSGRRTRELDRLVSGAEVQRQEKCIG